MKVCIISNSHAASLKDALEQNGDEFPTHSFTFFAAPAGRLGTARADEERRVLIPEGKGIEEFLIKISGGLSEIAVDAFDAFFIYGLSFTLPWLDTRLSSAVKAAAINGTLVKSLAHNWMDAVCRLTSKPVFVGPVPLYADIDSPFFVRKVGAVSRAASPVPFETVCRMIEAHERPGNVTYLWQDPATISSGFRTRVEYSTGSRRFKEDETIIHADVEIRHMNADYGLIVLRRLAGALNSLPAR